MNRLLAALVLLLAACGPAIAEDDVEASIGGKVVYRGGGAILGAFTLRAWQGFRTEPAQASG